MRADPGQFLTELGARYGLNGRQLSQLRALLGVLEGDRHAPIAPHSAARALEVHVSDSLTALELAELAGARTITDLGSGAGLPGLVLAVARPDTEVLLLESQARKCAFIDRSARQLGLENARSVQARAERWPAGIEASDAVLARAVAAQTVVLEYAAPLLRVGGSLIDWRGRRSEEEELAADAAAAQLGLRRVEVLATTPFPGARDHHLHVFTKATATPARFPRREGVALKRPLGA